MTYKVLKEYYLPERESYVRKRGQFYPSSFCTVLSFMKKAFSAKHTSYIRLQGKPQEAN